MQGTEFLQMDQILPQLALPHPCPIRVTVTDRDVCLHVGPRDWQWDRKTGTLIGAGTAIGDGAVGVLDSVRLPTSPCRLPPVNTPSEC
jgi:hypothetical protein